jgi:hypothetical protein
MNSGDLIGFIQHEISLTSEYSHVKRVMNLREREEYNGRRPLQRVECHSLGITYIAEGGMDLNRGSVDDCETHVVRGLVL